MNKYGRIQSNTAYEDRREPVFSAFGGSSGTKLPRGQYDPRDFRGAGYGTGPEDRINFDDAARRRQMENRRRDDMGEARRKAASRRRFIEHRRGALLAVLIVLFTFLLLFGIYKLAFVVRSVSVTGNTIYSEEEIIEASGVKKGVNLYSFRASAASSRVTFNCPYIGKVEVDRTVPSSVALTVTEDSPAYSAVIFGETTVLSEGLRVLEVVPDGAAPDGIIKLKLPGIRYSVSGRVVDFADSKDERAVRTTLEAISESALAKRIASVDLTDPFAITASCDGKYLLSFGNSTDMAKKLKAAAKVLEDEMFSSGNKARLDLSDVTKTSVVFDNTIAFD